jgi:ABC-type multidrug transport system ATPase subunit/pSer/pThr/pTyr-binding forkhead associated (FHA) protein
MKTCSACRTANADGNRFCQQCGRPLDAALPHEATVRWTGQQMPIRLPRHAAPITALFGSKDRLVIGRAPDCDVCLPHPMVSRYHALLERLPQGLRLRDLASVNGVSVAGRRITEPVLIHEGQRVGVGPFLFTLRNGVIHSLDSSRSLRLEARQLEKVVSLPDGQKRKLLDNVNLVVNPGEFVSLLGPSGSGKSTLMDCLNGRRRATGGVVLANGEDFYQHFDSFRQSLGYVPQKDIVHTQLTVHRALYYTARLRLPTDTDPAELHARIEAVVREMELGPHRDTLVANLSGGQIKRVSLGAELLAQPCLLYIDEATSGLDAGTEARMMRLFRRLSDEGRSIICITHNVDNVEQCHLALILARGKVVYYGPPHEAPGHFGVRRISDIYDRLGEKSLEEWERAFVASETYQEFVAGRLAARAADTAEIAVPDADEEDAAQLPFLSLSSLLADSRKLVSLSNWPPLADHFRALTARYLHARKLLAPVLDSWHQFRILTKRYVELTCGDRRGLRLLLLQAPLVAVFLLIGFINKDYRGEVPLPRPLTDSERRLLTLVQGIDELLAGNQLTPAQRRALEQLRQPALDAAQTESLRASRFTLNVHGEPTTVTGGELIDAARRLRESKIADNLLSFDGPVVPDRRAINPRFTYILLFILVMIVLWFGCNNAAKEIVKEEAIYGRERAVNLGIVPYLASKFLVLTLITALHAFMLMALVLGSLELLQMLGTGYTAPPPEYRLAYLPQLGVLVLLAMSGVALGLLLSACVSTPDRANALLPYVLIPQLILGGGVLDVQHGLLAILAMALSPVYWAYRAVHLGAGTLPAGFPGHVDYADGLGWPCLALVIQTIVMLAATAWALRRKEA